MKEGVGYTVTLNIVIIFIVIIFTFLSGILIYFKSNKVSNVITDAIEKYEGYNEKAINEISLKLSSLGYNVNKITCSTSVNSSDNDHSIKCNIIDNENAKGKNGYCVYLCNEGEYYYYKVRTNMIVNIPIINNILNFPIYSNTNRLYDFEKNLIN